MNDLEGQLRRLLDQQKSEAEYYVSSTASEATYKAFAKAFYEMNGSLLSSSTSGDQISIDFPSIDSLIDRWINELYYFVDDIKLQLQMYDPITYEDINRVTALQQRVEYTIIQAYGQLKSHIQEIETDFSNVAIAYKSHIESAYNDMLIFYNNHKGIVGAFSKFSDISVYVHGIEDDGSDFFGNIPDVSQAGDIVIHETRDGGTKYYIVVEGENGLELRERDETTIKNTTEYASADGRVHMIYETEIENEHRQKTSNDLAGTLIGLGLMQGEKNIRFHAHSYGGRRSLQFALDYPQFVQSITTIGTPYDTNQMANIGDKAANLTETGVGWMNKYPHQDGEYIEVASLGTVVSGVKLNDNAYGDMINTSMDEAVATVTSANPEIYDDLQGMYITAVTGRQSTIIGSLPADGAVGAKSQSGAVISEFIDEQPVIKIFKFGASHSAQQTNEEFKAMMKEANELDLR